ncbi:TerD family protein [Streptomyces albidoflavus]|uniref:TerD family protein n=1 Tax=Streptomyces TaxID=1883 RepID=UPI00100862FD|nr:MULTISPECIES: TerD family protein [unclassified Streptomyces]WSD57419.1 TerD domain-containing protein [Streptomyces albidoflavus]MBK3381211.1 TerD family protein [Streptomyces sp. DEF147AK]MBK3387562.1 TerD family protein [Streptomyces sp. DEF1AK]WTC45906.1 TerD domain-containing protein [Streptomyces albidoflavus]WTE00525.1 TerD domain-containing protein [Streptomyces albidoflavus]
MSKGANTPVPQAPVRLRLHWRHGAGVPDARTAALLVTEDGRVAPDGVVGGDRPVPGGAVRHEGRTVTGGRTAETLHVDLPALPDRIERVVLVALVADGTFGEVPGLDVTVTDAAGDHELARYESRDTTTETAFVAGELYRRQGGWKFRAVGQGYAGGAAELAAAHGLSPGLLPAPRTPAAPAPARPAAVTLTKAAPSVSLAKQGATTGALHVNLNWQAPPAPRGRFARNAAPQAPLDLDLGALYELADGTKGVVQALGNAFGDLGRPPWIHLDGDDRTGAVAAGENLTVNLDHTRDFRRVLVFVTIYEGAADFSGLHATVTLRPQYGAPVTFSLDECDVPSPVCALALLTQGPDGLVVRREARYLVPGRRSSPQRALDEAYGWGLRWTPGRK